MQDETTQKYNLDIYLKQDKGYFSNTTTNIGTGDVPYEII
jgi:hypothetical protein